MRQRFIVSLLASAVLLAACGKPDVAAPEPAAESAISATPVLATVGASPITEAEVELAVTDNLGEQAALFLDEQGRRKVLESLVVSRAMAQQAEKTLDAEARALLDRRVAAYREQLLVKTYLRDTLTPEPVTNEMVESYYREHPDRFGALKRWEFELLESLPEQDDKTRDAVLATLARAKSEADWKALAQTANAEGERLSYRRSSAVQGSLAPDVDALLLATNEGAVSDVRLSEGRARRVRVLKLEQTPPKPLSEVSAEIRKALVPMQLKKAVKSASDTVLSQVKVDYTKPVPSASETEQKPR